MKRNYRVMLIMILIVMFSMSASVQAAVLEITPTAPSPGDQDIANLVGTLSDANNVGTGENPPYTNDATTYVAHDRGGQGQTFVTGDNEAGYLVTGVWVQHVDYTTEIDQTWYRMQAGSQLQIRITDPAASGTDEFVLASETYDVTGAEENALPSETTNDQTGTGSWFHVTLDTPVWLAANTEYGFDLTSISGLSGVMFFETNGIRDDADGGNPYADGSAYVTGAGGAADNTLNPAPGDHVFVIELDAAASKEKIIWVSEAIDRDVDGDQDDQGWVDMLNAAGYDVDVRLDYWQNLEGIDANDANDYVGELNAADLVIVSRTANSGGYDDGNEPTLWNSITSPMILMSSHIARNSRWLWFNSADLLELLPAETELTAPDHPIFTGLTSPVSFFDPNVGSGSSNFFVVTDAGNGSVLATGDGLVQIAEWAAGTEFYTDANQWAGGTRMFFTAGTQEVGGEQPQGAMNLSADGQQVFLAAVDYMIPLEPVDPGTDNLRHHYSFDSDATDDVAGANGTPEGGAVIADGALLTTAQDQWLSLPGADIAMNTYEEVTLSAWYTPEAGGNASWSMLAFFGGNENGVGGNGLFITTARGDDVSRAAISVGDLATPWASESGANGPEYDDGLLHHMVGTFNGDVVLYIDGAETGRTATSETNDLSQISTELALLAKGGYDGDPEWIGQIHEFSIYDRALSPAEVLFLYNQGPN